MTERVPKFREKFSCLLVFSSDITEVSGEVATKGVKHTFEGFRLDSQQSAAHGSPRDEDPGKVQEPFGLKALSCLRVSLPRGLQRCPCGFAE